MASAAATTTTAVVGIDVSQGALDACAIAPDGRVRQATFANTPAGHAEPLARAGRDAEPGSLHFCTEATGGYEDAVATHLHAAGRRAGVVNPTRIKYAGRMRGRGDKTDRAGARLIAEYARRETPPAWCPPAADVRESRALARRRDDLRELAAHEKARLGSPLLTPAAKRSVARVVKLLGQEADRMQAAADAVIAAPAGLNADRDRLASIPGVGGQTASTARAEVPALDRVPAAPSAAAAGRAPREFTSGASVRGRTRLSKAGNARLRKALYLPTLTAIRFNPVLRGFFARLVKAGKPKMQAVGACMRKLVMLCYGVLKNRTPFDPKWGARITP